MFFLSVLTIGLLSRVAPSVASLLAAGEFVLGLWGLAYTSYLWVSFFLIASLRLPGCEFTAITHVVSGRKVHWCVDSVLNALLDEMQDRRGLVLDLLKTESAQKWIVGLVALTVFLGFLASGLLGAGSAAALVGVFTTFYLAYDKTIHRVSIDRPWLKGHGDYPRLILLLLGAKRQ